ncbi:hypothetical protein CIP100629_01855 [Corynebacterium diphtheriae]|nr:hypothetical protein CIP100629_01855 [Corynebacterium diphtheriae]
MTTITPKAAHMITLDITTTSPFHHGAGTAGNTSILRTQDVVQKDGTITKTPFLSAASIRHTIREHLAWHTAHTLQWENGTLTKQLVDLIWTGGAVSSTGSRINLDLYRRVHTLYPALTLLGYAAQSDIVTGTLRATDLILVCQENNWRLPQTTQGTRRAAAYRGEEFGTRHDQANTPAGQYLTLAHPDITTAQMIWDTQILITGSRLYGQLTLTPAATPQHKQILGAAMHLWAPNGELTIGAKTAQGYGQARLAHTDPQWGKDLEEWTKHLTTNRNEINDLLQELAS